MNLCMQPEYFEHGDGSRRRLFGNLLMTCSYHVGTRTHVRLLHLALHTPPRVHGFALPGLALHDSCRNAFFDSQVDSRRTAFWKRYSGSL